jgi:hypothetical protein
MVISGTTLTVDFGTTALWKWDGAAWTQLTPADPENMPENMAASSSTLYADFETSGLWKWNGSSWSQLTGSNSTIMAGLH